MSSSPMRMNQCAAYIDQALNMQPIPASMMYGNRASGITEKAFWLALVLTGSTEHAEWAVSAAIQALPSDDICQAALIAEVAKTSWERLQTTTLTKEDVREASLLIPPELQRVLELSAELRSCFCFRILAGMSSQACARLMSLHPEEVDCLLRLALCTLAVVGRSSISSTERRSY